MPNKANTFALPFTFFYLLTIFCGLALPSDANHGLLSPKSLSFLCTCLFATLYLITAKKVSLYQIKLLTFLPLAAALLLLWLFFSLAHDPLIFPQAIDQFKLFALSFLFPLLTLFLLSEKLLEAATILKSMIYINTAACLLKIFAVTLHIMGIIQLWDFFELIGVRYVQMHITGSLVRLQTSIDVITPFLLFFALQAKTYHLQISPSFRKIYCFIALLSTAISFSRFLILVAVLAFLLHLFTLNRQKLLRLLLLSLCLLAALPAIAGTSTINAIIEKRLKSQKNKESDDLRRIQVRALEHTFDKHRLFGQGMGSSAIDYTRDKTLTHSYEVQWLAFLMQLGLIGTTLLFIPIAYITKAILSAPLSREKVALSLLYSIWIVGGLTNPYLISLTSGIIYAMFLCGARPHCDTAQEDVIYPSKAEGKRALLK